jgi:hypothetical protein
VPFEVKKSKKKKTSKKREAKNDFDSTMDEVEQMMQTA